MKGAIISNNVPAINLTNAAVVADQLDRMANELKATESQRIALRSRADAIRRKFNIVPILEILDK